MSGTFRLKKRREESIGKNLRYSDTTLGGWEDVYIRPQGECHPDFTATTIGRPDGVKMCFRRKAINSSGEEYRIDAPDDKDFKNTILPAMSGMYRYSPSLYNVTDDYPTQMNNPQWFWDRRIPSQNTLIRRDLLHPEIKYNATGIRTNRVHAYDVDKGKLSQKDYHEYYYDYTPADETVGGKMEWAPMIGTNQSQSLPPYKWDLTRLHQSYPDWKRSQEHFGNDVNSLDTKHFVRVV